MRTFVVDTHALAWYLDDDPQTRRVSETLRVFGFTASVHPPPSLSQFPQFAPRRTAVLVPLEEHRSAGLSGFVQLTPIRKSCQSVF